MLSNVNMLFLGTSVLVMLDRSYVSRFWVSVPTPTRQGAACDRRWMIRASRCPLPPAVRTAPG